MKESIEGCQILFRFLSVFVLFFLLAFFSFGLVSAEDTTPPISEINYPPANSWQNQSFIVNITDVDEESGLQKCEYRIRSKIDGEWQDTITWVERDCNELMEVTVGIDGSCNVEGKDGNGKCRIFARSSDNEGNPSSERSRYVSIDWTTPTFNISNQKVNIAEGLSYELNITDATAGLYSVQVSDDENFEVDSGDGYILKNITALSEGTYSVTIIAIDNAGNSNNQTIAITVLVENQKLAEGESIEVGDDEMEIIFNSASSDIKSINIPKTTNSSQEVVLDFTAIKNTTDGTTKVSLGINNISLKRESVYNYTAEILAGTTISGTGWDGKLVLPTMKAAEDYTVSGGAVDLVINLGSGVELIFDKAVKVVLGGQTGKKAGWIRGTGALTTIPTICNSGTDYSNVDGTVVKECYFDDGEDLIIWTYHFTSFASYTANTGGTTSSNLGIGGGSTCVTKWSCTEWEECSQEGLQKRVCSYLENFCAPKMAKPAETQSCEVQINVQPVTEEITEKGRGFFLGMTGAVIGTLDLGGTVAVVVFVLLIITGAVILIRKKKE
ncbi:MAG: hypothetical protein KJ905_02865 [Nanoarchaeota archaeon]|nr:hypothetical protein [Nanoarchaeota archaeon]MBU1501691.1 hypothetical protein [Nanoarchaeota archaeon]MBU2458750.1 hypothetical protein [Nanoarchaeota archaeon]